MLRIIKYKILLFTLTVTSLTICALTLCVGGLEIYADFAEHADAPAPVNSTGRKTHSTHKVLALSIFSFANFSIFGNIVYMALYALRGLRYSWYMSCNYFMYIVSEIVSVVCVLGIFQYLNYPVGLAILVVSLSVLLFFVTCAAECIFTQIEHHRTEETEIDSYGKELLTYRRRVDQKSKNKCVHVSLYAPAVNKGAAGSS